MKKEFFLLFLLFLLASCASPVIPLVESPVVEDTALPVLPATFTPIPTFTETPLPTAGFPTFVAPTALPGQPNVIQFAAGGTYADVTDVIPMGASKTYSVNAMKGQVMSVSVLPQIPDSGWGYVPMQIKGADGSVLCPQTLDQECSFWRGVLPGTQEYLVTLTPNGDVPQFVLRVAVNPPGTDFQYFQYQDPATGFSLAYSDAFVPALPVPGNYKFPPQLSLRLVDSSVYENTNLGEVFLFAGGTAEAQIVAACMESNVSGGGSEIVVGNETINGYTFVHSTADGAGAGNLYQQEIYRMANDGVCYEVIYYIHSSNIGNFPPGIVTEFDRNLVVQRLSEVFSTLIIQ
ncbi:MAG: hypothetical protein HYZ23_09430 [Chloroflexi bacterium]|nr:hypothetical protein [Chloroflexota bacterium]